MYLCVWNGVRSYFLLSQTSRARLYPPPPQKETLEENLSLPEPFLKVIPCQCMSSGRCSWVTADDMRPSGRNTNETAKVFAEAERVCQFASLSARSVFAVAFCRFWTVVNVLKCGQIFTAPFGSWESEMGVSIVVSTLSKNPHVTAHCMIFFVWEHKNSTFTGRCCAIVSMQLFKDTKIRLSGQKMSLHVDKVGGHIEFRIRIVCHSPSWT